MRTYLVTGGAGFIGSNYIHYMFRKYDNEIRIINVDALTYAGNLENLKDIENRDNYTFVKANICDKEAIAKIFAENLKVIYPDPAKVRTVANTTLGELRLVKAPSNLIELAYHDNAEDAFWIIDNIQLIARTLVLALTEYFGIPFVEPSI